MHLKNKFFVLLLLIFLFSYGYAAELCMLDPNASKVAAPVPEEQLSKVLYSMGAVRDEFAPEGLVQPNQINSISITLAGEENPRRDVRLSYSWPERIMLTISDNIKASNAREFIVYPYEVKVYGEEVQNLSKPTFAVEGALKQYFDNGRFKIEITGDKEPYVLSLSLDLTDFEKVPERIDGTIKFNYKDAFFEKQPSIDVRIEKDPCKTLAEDSESYLIALNSLSECHNLAAGITKIAFLELFLKHYKYYYPQENYEAHLREEIKNASQEEKEIKKEYFEALEDLLKFDSWIISSYDKSLSYLEEIKGISSEDEDSTIDEAAEGAIAVENARKNEWLAYKEFMKDPFDPDYREAWVDSVVALKKSEREFGIVANLPKEEQAKEISDEELTKQMNKEINENYGYDDLLIGNLTQLQIEIGEQIKLMSEAQASLLEKIVVGVTSILTLKVFPENQEKLQLNIAHLESEKRGIGYIVDLLQGKLDVPILGNPGEETKNLSKRLEDERYAAIKGNRLSILQIREIAKIEREKLEEELKGNYPIKSDTPEDTQMKVRALQRFEKYWDDIYAALDDSVNPEIRKRLYVLEKDFIQNINEADFLLNEVQTLEIEQQNLNALIATLEERADRSKWDVSVFRIALDSVKQNKEKALAKAGELQIQSNGIGKIIKLLEDGNSWAQIGTIDDDAEIKTAVLENLTVQFLIEKDSLLRDAQENAKVILLKIENMEQMNNKQRSAEFSRIIKQYVSKNLEGKQAKLSYENAKRYETYMEDYGIEALRLRAYEEYIQASISFPENGWGQLAGEHAALMNSGMGRVRYATRDFIYGITTPKFIVIYAGINAIIRGFVIIQGAREASTMESFLARTNLRSANYTANVRALEVPKTSTLQKLKEFVFTRDINPITRAFPKLSLNYWTSVAANKLGSAIFARKYGGLLQAEEALARARETGLVTTLSKNEFLPISNAERSFAEFAGHEMSVVETSRELFYFDGGSGIMRITTSVEGEGGIVTLKAREIAELAQKTRNLPRVFSYLQKEGLATAEEVQYAQRFSAILDNAAQKAGATSEAAVPTSFEAFTQAEAVDYIKSLVTVPGNGRLPALLEINSGYSTIAGKDALVAAAFAANKALAAVIPVEYISTLPASELIDVAGATITSEGLLKSDYEALFAAGDDIKFVDYDGTVKEAINPFGSHANFIAEMHQKYQKDFVFKELIDYIAAKNGLTWQEQIQRLFTTPAAGEGFGEQLLVQSYSCGVVACYRFDTGNIYYRVFRSKEDLGALYARPISSGEDIEVMKSIHRMRIGWAMPHEAAHYIFDKMLSPSAKTEWLNHVEMALEGKINDPSIRAGFEFLSKDLEYASTPFETKVDELFAFKVGYISGLATGEGFPVNFSITNYDLWFLRKNGIISDNIYQTLINNPHVMQLGGDAFAEPPINYISNLRAGEVQKVLTSSCSFGCSLEAKELSAENLTIAQGTQSSANAVEAQQMEKEVGVAIKDFGRVEEIAINSEVVAMPEQTARISLKCSDCRFEIVDGLLKVEETGKEIKISPLEFENIKKIEISMPPGESLRYSYRLPTDAELTEGLVEKGGALIRVFKPGVAGLNMLEIVSTDIKKAIALLGKDVPVKIEPKIVIDKEEALGAIKGLVGDMKADLARITKSYEPDVLPSVVSNVGLDRAVDGKTSFEFYNFIYERVGAQYKPIIGKYGIETLTDAERQLILNSLVLNEHKIYFNSKGELVNFGDYLNDYYRETDLSFEVSQGPLDTEVQQGIMQAVLLTSQNIPHDTVVEIMPYLDIIRNIEYVQKLAKRFPQYEKEIMAIGKIAFESSIPQIVIKRGQDLLAEIPLAVGGDLSMEGAALGVSASFKNSKGVKTRLSLINVKNNSKFYQMMATLLHETDHSIGQLFSKSYRSQIGNIVGTKLDRISAKKSALSKKVLNKEIDVEDYIAETKRLDPEIDKIIGINKDLEERYSEELRRELYVQEGTAENAVITFYANESNGLKALGKFDGLDRASINDFIAQLDNISWHPEYPVGFLTTQLIRNSQPEMAFKILYQTKDIQSTITNFDELQKGIEAELGKK